MSPLRAFVNGGLHDHSASARVGAVDGERFDPAPLTGRPPILGEVTESVVRILCRMLFPVWVIEPDAVGVFHLSPLERREELRRHASLGIVPQMVQNPSEKQRSEDTNDD